VNGGVKDSDDQLCRDQPVLTATDSVLQQPGSHVRHVMAGHQQFVVELCRSGSLMGDEQVKSIAFMLPHQKINHRSDDRVQLGMWLRVRDERIESRHR